MHELHYVFCYFIYTNADQIERDGIWITGPPPPQIKAEFFIFKIWEFAFLWIKFLVIIKRLQIKLMREKILTSFDIRGNISSLKYLTIWTLKTSCIFLGPLTFCNGFFVVVRRRALPTEHFNFFLKSTWPIIFKYGTIQFGVKGT